MAHSGLFFVCFLYIFYIYIILPSIYISYYLYINHITLTITIIKGIDYQKIPVGFLFTESN